MQRSADTGGPTMDRPGALTQPPYDTSLLGVVVAALRHYRIARGPAEAFVLSGHAFAINIHTDLCPSAPYCWNYRPCLEMLRGIGLQMREIGTLMPTADAAEKRRLEARVRAALEQGTVCSLLNLDHQLVLGRDNGGFLLAQPWGPEPPSTPARLTFGTWPECQTGPPVEFVAFTPCEPASPTPLENALAFAVDAWRRPAGMTEEPYGFGPEAYERWLAALESDDIDVHGNWWNASVWGECRAFAAEYFTTAAHVGGAAWLDAATARSLAERYASLATTLRGAADRTVSNAKRRDLIAEARDLDAGCMERLDALDAKRRAAA